MARYSGMIGFITTELTTNGVWVSIPVERRYYGDLTRNHKRWEDNQKVNSDITLQNEISIIADPYALQNFQSIRYAELMGSVWKVTAVDVQYPRLVLSIGGVYNGERPSSTP